MQEQGYTFYLADDRNGNKALFAVKGHFTCDMEKIENSAILDDPRFFAIYSETINGIKEILDHATVALPTKKERKNDNENPNTNQRGTAAN